MAGLQRHLFSTYGLSLATVLVLTGYGFATNDGYVGMLLGGAAGLALDPITIAIGLIIGFVCRPWWLSLVASVIIGVAMRFALTAIEPDFPAAPAYVAIAQILAIFAWAGVAAAIRAFKERQRSEITTDNDELAKGDVNATQDQAL